MRKTPEDEKREWLAREGERSLPLLNTREDVISGTTWLGAAVSAEGSAVYLMLGKLGAGATTLRLVIRRVGKDWFNASSCTVEANDREVGTFTPNKVRVEKLPNGRVVQLFDAGIEDVRPMVLAILDAPSARFRLLGEGGTEVIDVNAYEIAEMRKVLASYEYLNSGAAGPP